MSYTIKFREDLDIREDIKNGIPIYTIGDPVTNRHFRVNEPEYLIIKLLDGKNSLEYVLDQVNQKTGEQLVKDDIDDFVQSLTKLGLTEGSEIRYATQAQSILYKKYKLYNPDKFFDRIIPHVKFLFTKKFILFSMFILAFSTYILLKRTDELFHYVKPGDTGFEMLLLTILGMIIIIVSHEFAHGLCLKSFGGRVPELGFIMILLLPAFYCDVSSAWMLEKKQKLYVTLAGGYYELVVGSLATIIWHFADPYTWLANYAYILMISSVFTIGFNFNPLIKLDGYYLLSDFLEMPNLRAEAFDYLPVMLRINKPKRLYSLKEKMVFSIYAPFAMVFSTFILFSLYSLISNFLINSMHLLGIILSIALLYAILKQIIKGMLFKKPTS